MQLTKYTDISLRVMMHLAIIGDELSTINEVSELYNVSKNHLMKVVNKLATLGYVKSAQGRGGGISLAVSAKEIGVGDIVRAMESSLNVIDCEKAKCPIRSACFLKRVLTEASSVFLKSLDQYTIADLVRNKPQLEKIIYSDMG